MIPVGTDALSPAPHHDIYSIEDLRQLIYAHQGGDGLQKPVCVKIAAVHNVAAIASGIARAGADIIYLDGFRGGTGAAPTVIRDHVGIPIEIALAVVDQRLREEGIRHRVSIVAAGGIRSAGRRGEGDRPGRGRGGARHGDAARSGLHALPAMLHGPLLLGHHHAGPRAHAAARPLWGAQRLSNLVRAWSPELRRSWARWA